MGDRATAYRRRKRMAKAIVPAASLLCLIIGVVAWIRIPSKNQLTQLETQRNLLVQRIDQLAMRAVDPNTAATSDGASQLPVRLAFADFVERIHCSAKDAGIDNVRIETQSAGEGSVPAVGLRGFAGTLRFSGEWNDIVKFFGEIELGTPIMRIRSLLAEPTEDRIRVECTVDAWSMPTVEVAR
ncbi:MAG: hypothetical protein H6832_12970 [Planctomycetes bacterium]|nr:hypothetical protein [Planctomycetota bacterium]